MTGDLFSPDDGDYSFQICDAEIVNFGDILRAMGFPVPDTTKFPSKKRPGPVTYDSKEKGVVLKIAGGAWQENARGAFYRRRA